MESIDPRLEALRRAFVARAARNPDEAFATDATDAARPVPRAGVALVVRPEPRDLELLVIKRATRPGDPWSGHMALPGGRASSTDASILDTATRETREEVGIDLEHAGRLLGRLPEVWPRGGPPPIRVAPFVFAVPNDLTIALNYEVDAAFWIPLGHLSAPGSAAEYLYARTGGEEHRMPAIAYDSHLIWGLTHHIMTDFLEVVRMANTGPEAR